MPTLKNCVLFDLDGTLIDTAPDLVYTLNLLLKEHNLPPVDYAQGRQVASHGAAALIKLRLDHLSEANIQVLRLRFLEIYMDHIFEQSVFFNGMRDVLHYLNSNNIPWGIVTNKPRNLSELLLKQIEWPNNIPPQVLVTPCDVSKPKPDAEPMHLALEQLNCTAETSWYVGDHKRDIDAAHNANMISVAAEFGYIHEDDAVENWNPHYVIKKADELIELLKNNFQF